MSSDPARDVAQLVERLLMESGEVADADMNGMMAAVIVTTLDGKMVMVEVEPQSTAHR